MHILRGNLLFALLIFNTLAFMCISAGTSAQGVVRVQESILTGIELPSEATYDTRIFPVAGAQTTLELEANRYQVAILETEVLTYQNTSGIKDDSRAWVNAFKTTLERQGYALSPSQYDLSFTWIIGRDRHFLLYTSAGKKEADIYLGALDNLPDYLANIVPSPQDTAIVTSAPPAVITEQHTNMEAGSPENINQGLIGNWGNLAGPKVSWQDESTGVMVVSGVSKGFGIELRKDGSFLQSSVVTSGRPNYRVFVSTTGTWNVVSDQILFSPEDRHYRKWENEIIMVDEHSVPEPYQMFWRKDINKITQQECLYVRFPNESEDRELCRE